MKIMWATACVISIFLSGCDGGRKRIEADTVKEVKASISNQLKDPDAVRWRGVRSRTEKVGDHYRVSVCGEFNAKNGYGAYVGYVPFNWYDGSMKVGLPCNF